MSTLFEVHSFVNKFLTLCNNGERANLSLKCQDGKTVIELQLHLQPVPPPSYHPQSSTPSARPSPSRLRRSARRAHFCAAANNATKTEQVSANCSQSEDKTLNTAEQAATKDATDKTENVLQSQNKDVATICQDEHFPAEKADDRVPAEQVVPPQAPPQHEHGQEQIPIPISGQESHPRELGSTISSNQHQQFELICNFCNEGFENEEVLKEHTSIKHNSGRIRFRRKIKGVSS